MLLDILVFCFWSSLSQCCRLYTSVLEDKVVSVFDFELACSNSLILIIIHEQYYTLLYDWIISLYWHFEILNLLIFIYIHEFCCLNEIMLPFFFLGAYAELEMSIEAKRALTCFGIYL